MRSDPDRRSSRRARPRPRALLAVAGAAALAGALLATVVGATARATYVGELVVNLSGYLVVAGLAAALALVGARRWGGAALAVAVAAYHAAPAAALYLGPAELGGPAQGGVAAAAAPGSGPALTVASVNLNYRNEDAEPFLAWIARARPDVLGVLEVTPFWSRVLDGLGDLYPHRLSEPARPRAFTMRLLSRHPLAEGRVHATEHASRAYLEAVFDVGGTPLHVVLVHPSRPGLGWGTFERNAYLMQVARTTRWRERSVLLGDLNATVWSPIYDDVLAETGLLDSRQGFGWLPSWRSGKYLSGLWLDLDHILVGESVRVLERGIGPDVASDHRPATARLRLEPVADGPNEREAPGRREPPRTLQRAP